MKISFVIDRVDDQDVIVVGGELFDWGLDENALSQANIHFSNKETMAAIHADIKNYFLECLSEHLGFSITIGEVNKALKKGFIEK
jgi:hypothetical protein